MSTPYPTLFKGNVKINPGEDTTLYGLGTIEVSVAPTSDFQVSTKKYVDDAIAGLDWKEACDYKTVAALSNTVAAAGSGVGKTLTNSGTQAALSVDGTAVSVSDRILVDTDGTSGTGRSDVDNGIYVVTNIGSGSTNWILTRAADADGSPSNEVDNGMTVLITHGATVPGTVWTLQSAIDPVTVDTDPQVFVQTGAGGAALTWSQVLGFGNISGANDAVMTNGQLIRGVDAATGGVLGLRGGNSSGASPGGDITITSGTAGSSNTDGGDIILTAEDGNNGGQPPIGGVVNIEGGYGTTGAGGSISVTAGDSGNNPGSGNGGDVTIFSGEAESNTSMGGLIEIRAGSAKTGGADGGPVTIHTGGVTTGSGSTGLLTLHTGDTAGTGDAGNVDIFGGQVNNGIGGSIILRGGNATGSGTGGNVELLAGTTTGGTDGTIELQSPTNVTTAGNLYMPINQVPGSVTSLMRVTGVTAPPTNDPGSEGQIAYDEAGKDLYLHEGSGTWTALSTNLGTVTSVALAAPSELTVSGSPVTSSGTLTLTKATQSANTVWAGPTSGGAAQPTFRALVTADIPTSVQRISTAGGTAGDNVTTTNDVVFISTITSIGIATGSMGTATDGKSIRIVYVSQFAGSSFTLSLTGFDANGGTISALTFTKRGHSAVMTWDNTIARWFITGGSGVGITP